MREWYIWACFQRRQASLALANAARRGVTPKCADSRYPCAFLLLDRDIFPGTLGFMRPMSLCDAAEQVEGLRDSQLKNNTFLLSAQKAVVGCVILPETLLPATAALTLLHILTVVYAGLICWTSSRGFRG